MTKKALKLSIVIPVYNDQDHLQECLESIANQTKKPDEVIIVDNNCTDESMKIAKKFKFVRIVKEKKQSVLYARTAGLNAAKSDVIGRIDADTLIDKDWSKNVLAIFKDKGVMAATGPMYFHDMPLSPGNVAVDHLFKGPLYKYDKKFPFLAGCNMAIRKSAWDIIKNELCDDKTIHEDLDIAIHLYQRNLKIAYDRRMLAGMSSRRYDDKPKQIKRYMNMTANAFDKHNMRPIGVHVSSFGYSLGYVLLWPLRRSYNPKTGRRSLKQFMQGNVPRKNPMD